MRIPAWRNRARRSDAFQRPATTRSILPSPLRGRARRPSLALRSSGMSLAVNVSAP